MPGILYKRKAGFEPDFNQLLKVLKKEISGRPTLFEFAFNDRLVTKLSGDPATNSKGELAPFKRLIKSFVNAGNDIFGWKD